MAAVNSKTILFVHYGDNWVRGSEMCLIQLIKTIDKTKFKPIVWTNNVKLSKVLNKQCDIIVSPFHLLINDLTPNSTLKDYREQIKFGKEIIENYKVDLIHANSGAPCQWMLPISKLTNTPIVTQLHSDYNLRDRVTLGLHACPKIVTVSRAISKNLLCDGVAHKKIKVISNGCELPTCIGERITYDVKWTLGIKRDAFLLASIGSLIHRKGMDILIRSIASLNCISNDHHLLIIGDGPEKKKLLQLAEKHNVSDNVHFVGEQANIHQWLNSGVDLFVSGARDEAFGLVVAEAALANIPVVAPNVGGIPEVLVDQLSALLYEPTSIPDLCRAINTILTNPTLKKQLCYAAKLRVQTRFSVQMNTRSFEALYQEAITNPAEFIPQKTSLLHPIPFAAFSGSLRLAKKFMVNLFTTRETVK